MQLGEAAAGFVLTILVAAWLAPYAVALWYNLMVLR